MAKLTKSTANNIEVLSANGLSSFVDDTDGILKLKDTNGVVEPITNYTGNCNGEVIVQGTGTCSALRCGVNNTAIGAFSSSLGGQNNCALGAFSVVVGGCGNYTNQTNSFISHGGCNNITSTCSVWTDYIPCGSFIIGGTNNCICSSTIYGESIIGGLQNCICVSAYADGLNNISGGYNNGIITSVGVNTTCCAYGGNFLSIANSNQSFICTYHNQPCSLGVDCSSITNSAYSSIQIVDCTTNSCYGYSNLCGNFVKISNSYMSSICANGSGCRTLGDMSYIQESSISDSNNSKMTISYALPEMDSGYASFAQIEFRNNRITNANCSCFDIQNSRNSCIQSNTISGFYNCIVVAQPNILNYCSQRAIQNYILGGGDNKIIVCNTGDETSTLGTDSINNLIIGGAGNAIIILNDGLTGSGNIEGNVLSGGLLGRIVNSDWSTITNGLCNVVQCQTAFGSITQGFKNCIECGNFSSIGNGCFNRAKNINCSCYQYIGNGFSNLVCSNFNTIINGCQNQATNTFASVFSGFNNIACGSHSVILNGQQNRVTSCWGSVINGQCNCVTGTGSRGSVIINGFRQCATNACALIGTGNVNCATGAFSSVMNGANNCGNGAYSVVNSGSFNTAVGCLSFIGNGCANTAIGTYAFIGNGLANCATGCQNFIGGGQCHLTSSTRSAIMGGDTNTATGDPSFIGGGFLNSATAPYTFIGGGGRNLASCNNAFIGAGFLNCSTGINSLIAGGCCNTATACFSAVVGGGQNNASGIYSLVGNGLTNCATACYAGVFGGQNNIASCVYSYIAGCGITSSMACAFHANRYVATNLPNAVAGLPSGALWYDPADGNRVKYVP